MARAWEDWGIGGFQDQSLTKLVEFKRKVQVDEFLVIRLCDCLRLVSLKHRLFKASICIEAIAFF